MKFYTYIDNIIYVDRALEKRARGQVEPAHQNSVQSTTTSPSGTAYWSVNHLLIKPLPFPFTHR